MEVLLNDNYYGINYLNLERNKNIIIDKLLLKIDESKRNSILNQIENQVELNINIRRADMHLISLYKVSFIKDYIYSEEEHENTKEVLLEGNMLSNESVLGEPYNQCIIDIFYNWKNNIEINWEKIKDVEVKNSYLKACYLWNGDSFEIRNENDIYIDGELISCEEDVYYYLGQYIFGQRGFFGINLDSLEDFLIDIRKNNSVNMSVSFTHVDLIIEKTNKYFFETIVNLLEKATFKVKIIH
ncbi:barstar family protein [uncultured Chryseobacterium sp.]|uniref:barstar family protein n=1 Tax=uncultured Chryseobacterium sp. TaxID=259322 RepID=UPI0025DF0031|nr:barstar family protein [uncultured Chryseobacterium sp.]